MISKISKNSNIKTQLTARKSLPLSSKYLTANLCRNTNCSLLTSFVHCCKINFSTSKTDSPWIYSNIFQQFRKTPKGKVTLCWHPFSKNNKFSTHDISLRMKKQIEQAHIIVTQSKVKTKQMLVALKQKQRYYSNHETVKNNDQDNVSKIVSQQVSNPNTIENINHQKSLVYKQQGKYKQLYQLHIQMSKHLSIEAQSQEIRQNNEKRAKNQGRHRKTVAPQFMKRMTEDQAKLKQYMISKNFKQSLEAFKSEEGHAPIFSYSNDIAGKIKQYYDIGVKMAFVLQSFDIQANKRIIEQLQIARLPVRKQYSQQQALEFQEYNLSSQTLKIDNRRQVAYEILPIEDPVINNLALAGFPADRFSIQKIANYQNLKSMLQSRKKQSCAVSIQILGKFVLRLVQDIVEVFGKQQRVFMQITQNNYFRGEAYLLIQFIMNHQIDNQLNYHIVIAPYLPEFNQKLEGTIKQKKHIIGKMIAKQTHFVQLEYLGQQMAKLEKKQNTHSVNLSSLVEQLAIKLGTETTISILQRLLFKLLANYQSQQKLKQSIRKLVHKTADNITEDYIGIGSLTQQSRNKKNHI